jgi:hypothetical protein
MEKKIDWEIRLANLPELLTVRETQAVIGVGRKDVGRLVTRGLLKKHPSFVKSKIFKVSVVQFLTSGDV